LNPIAVTDVIDKQEWLGTAAEGTQKAVRKGYGSLGKTGLAIKDFLHGVWLGHPLHATLVHIPLGAFTMAAVADVVEVSTGSKSAAKAADTAVAAGIASAAVVALPGITDWHVFDEKPVRRLGMTHLLLNVAATGLYAGSYVARKTGRRGLGRVLGFASYGVLMASGYLGGSLAYEEKVGADHADRSDLPEEWTAVLADDELGEGQLRKVEAGGVSVLLVRQDGQIFALGNACSHYGCDLHEGNLEGGCVVCPSHGSTFSLESGRVQRGPAVYPQPRFDVRVAGGQIEVRAPRDSAEHNTESE